MKRVLIPALLGLLIFTPALRAADVAPLDQWTNIIPDDALLAEAPANGAITDKAAWEKLWKAWRPTEAVPAVDFAKEMVIVIVVGGPNRARLGPLKTDDKGNVDAVAMSTRMGGPGFGYVLVRVAKEGIVSVNGKAITAAAATGPASAPATAPATQQGAAEVFEDTVAENQVRVRHAEALQVNQTQSDRDYIQYVDRPVWLSRYPMPTDDTDAAPAAAGTVQVAAAPGGAAPGSASFHHIVAGPVAAPATAAATAPASAPAVEGKAVPFDTYSGYFVLNTYEPDKDRSLLIAPIQTTFDKIFGAGFVMNDKSHRLAANTFESNVVLAVIKRGNAPTEYTVESATLLEGTLTLKYQAKTGAGGASTFASPLIISVPRAGLTWIKFVENGVEEGTVGAP